MLDNIIKVSALLGVVTFVSSLFFQIGEIKAEIKDIKLENDRRFSSLELIPRLDERLTAQREIITDMKSILYKVLQKQQVIIEELDSVKRGKI